MTKYEKLAEEFIKENSRNNKSKYYGISWWIKLFARWLDQKEKFCNCQLLTSPHTEKYHEDVKMLALLYRIVKPLKNKKL